MNKINTDVVVIGGGPGGYPCAFRAADLGLNVVIVDTRSELGGVCLHEGCIPSKAWLHVVKLMQEVKEYQARGLMKPSPLVMDVPKMQAWVNSQVIGKLSLGLSGLSRKRKVKHLVGKGVLASANTVSVTDEKGEVTLITAKHIVLATGSRPIWFKDLPSDPRILTSGTALALENPKGRMLIIGAGVIGCELSGVFSAMGLEVMVCDSAPQIMPGTDEDMANIIQASLEKQGVRFLFSTLYEKMDLHATHIDVHLKGEEAVCLKADWVLMAIGRTPNTEGLGLETVGVKLSKAQHGSVVVNDRFETSVPHIYAVGDVAGGHLAHQATSQGRLCAEIISGLKRHYDVRSMPAVAYTHPELASVGENEASLKKAGIHYQTKTVSWKANGRAIASLQDEGLTRLFADESGRLLGAAIVGVGAGDIISELALALEMGSNIDDLSLTVRPHPTISETITLASELLDGTATDS